MDESTDIGLQFDKSSLSLALKIGVTFDCFNLSGKIQVLSI